MKKLFRQCRYIWKDLPWCERFADKLMVFGLVLLSTSVIYTATNPGSAPPPWMALPVIGGLTLISTYIALLLASPESKD